MPDLRCMALGNIDRLSGEENIGGGIKIDFAEAAGIDFFPDVIDQNIEDDITLLSSYTWYTAFFSPESIHYACPKINEKGIEGFQTDLIAVVPKDKEEHIRILLSARINRFVVLFTDANGKVKCIGTKEKPCKIILEAIDNKQEHAGRNENQIRISWRHNLPPPFYQGDEPVPGAVVCAPGTAVNSNATYSLAIPSGTTLPLPNSTYDVFIDGNNVGSATVPTLDPNAEIILTW